jgi:membrane associated rhomboid family serine protease|tara:strand:+ start:1461 stop:2183 length:723 start_codon:yes stop_codon:yes gene_type:complete
LDSQERNRVFYAIFSTALFLIIIWGVQILIEWGGVSEWRSAGNHPKEWGHWWGVLSMAFLHGSWEHIWNNTASFVVLNTLLFYFYSEIALKVWGVIFLFSGLFVFFLGVPGSNHVGASGVVYGLAFFVFTAGMMDVKHTALLRVSMAVLFLYGSIIWGIFPIEERVSWEGHLGGALAGVLLAFVYRKELPERPKTRWEIEEELELLKSERDASNPVKPNGKTSIVQIYRQLRHRGIDRGF